MHTFLMHKKVRRLSKGRSLARVFEVQEMLQRSLAAPFSDTEGLKTLLTCVTYSTCSMNAIDLSLWGRRTTVFKSADKVAALNAKLELWR